MNARARLWTTVPLLPPALTRLGAIIALVTSVMEEVGKFALMWTSVLAKALATTVPLGELPLSTTRSGHLRVLATLVSVEMASLALVISCFVIAQRSWTFSHILYHSLTLQISMSARWELTIVIPKPPASTPSAHLLAPAIQTLEAMGSFALVSNPFSVCLCRLSFILHVIEYFLMIFHSSFSSRCGANCHFDQQHVHFFDLGLGFWCLILWIGGHRSQLGLNFLFLISSSFLFFFSDNSLLERYRKLAIWSWR